MADSIISERLLKAHQVASILGVSRTQAYRLMAIEIPSIKIGSGTIRVREADLSRYLELHSDDHGSRKNSDQEK
jgi:excisionase family DNA binding protein